MLVDMPLEDLRKYKPDQTKENDFDKFWENTKNISRNEPLNEEINKIDYIIKQIDAYKVYYDGFGGARICGYYLLPKTRGPYPVILNMHEYGKHKADIPFYLDWLIAGFAVFSIDIRDQMGESNDNKFYQSPSYAGYLTKGIVSKEDYYYRGVYMDCVRAIDFLSERNEIDINRLCVTGQGQGGGLALAASALDDRVKLVISRFPSFCNFRRYVEWAEQASSITFFELTEVIKRYPEKAEEFFKTLSYFDNLNLCSWIKARTVMSVAMKDMLNPPSTIFAVYNRIDGQKHIEIMPYYVRMLEYNEADIDFGEKQLEYLVKYL